MSSFHWRWGKPSEPNWHQKYKDILTPPPPKEANLYQHRLNLLDTTSVILLYKIVGHKNWVSCFVSCKQVLWLIHMGSGQVQAQRTGPAQYETMGAGSFSSLGPVWTFLSIGPISSIPISVVESYLNCKRIYVNSIDSRSPVDHAIDFPKKHKSDIFSIFVQHWHRWVLKKFQQPIKLPPVGIQFTTLTTTGLEFWYLSNSANQTCVE